LIIRLIIQTILLDPTGAVWTDEAFNVSRLDPSGAVQADAEHPSCNQVQVASIAALRQGSTTQRPELLRVTLAQSRIALSAACQQLHHTRPQGA